MTIKVPVTWLLAIVMLLNLTYPVAELSQLTAIIYTLLYSVLLGLGGYAVSISTHRFLLSIGVAVGSGILNIFWNLNPEILALAVTAYVVLIVFQAIIIYVARRHFCPDLHGH